MAASSVTINQRFATLIHVLNLTKSSFAQSLDKTPSVVQHLIDGRNKPGYDLLCRVFEVYPNVSRDWLILGRGPMLLGSEAPTAPASSAPPPPAPAPELPLYAPETTARPDAANEAAGAVVPAAAAPEIGVAAPPVVLPEPLFVASENPRPAQPRLAPDAPLRPVDIAAVLAAASAKASRPAEAAAEVVASAPAAAILATAPGAAEAFVAALQVQQLQHQLALAELRNQHLLEQQGMLREMLELAKRGLG